jgi:uncharacterized protein YndB with AHSA1/START domain
MKKNDEPVVIEQTFNASVDTVWHAITRIDQMRRWYFENIPSFEPEAGFETRFSVQSGDRDFVHLWKVTEVVPLRRITYNWKYEGYPGDSVVVFELFEQDNRTRLRLTHRVRESFPGDIPEFKRESCVEGWTYFIKKSLKEFLEKSGESV